MNEALATLAVGAGFEPHVTVRSSSTVLVRSLVSAGIGVSVGSRAFCASIGPAVATVPFIPAVPILVTMATSTRPSPAARALIKHFLEQFGVPAANP